MKLWQSYGVDNAIAGSVTSVGYQLKFADLSYPFASFEILSFTQRLELMGFQHDSRSELIWITKHQRLPDACCSCGLFSDNRVTVKHVEKFTEVGKHSPGLLMSLFTLALHIFGPIGWVLSLVLEGNPDKETAKTIKKKSKVKITQCRLCHAAEPATMVETRGSSYSFLVHPAFKDRLEIVNRELE